MIISTALGSQKQFFVPKEYEELHASAVVSVQEALNNAGNPEIFQMHIQEARASLKKIEERGILQAKVDDLSTQIASLEKRFNQITTASSYQVQEQYVFSEDEFEFLQVFVHEGKQYYLGLSLIHI